MLGHPQRGRPSGYRGLKWTTTPGAHVPPLPLSFTSHCSDSLSEFRGQRVLLSYGPGLDFVVAFWACLRAGAVAVPAPAAKAATYRRLAAISAAGVDSGSS